MRVIADAGASSQQRAFAHDTVATIAARGGDWPTAESHLLQRVALAEPAVPQPVVWRLVEAQCRSGANDRAWETLQRYRPVVEDVHTARLWAEVASTRAMTTGIASEMIRLAAEFGDDPQLSGSLLVHVIWSTRAAEDAPASGLDQRAAVASDLYGQAFQALDRLIDRHGDALPMRRLQAESVEGSVEQITEVLRQRNDEPIRGIIDMVLTGRVPLGMLSVASGRPYGYVLSQRGVGHYIAGPSSEDDITIAKETVASAFDHPVVADESALLVAPLLGVFDRVRGRFSRLLTPDLTGRDVRRSRIEANGMASSSGSLTWNSALNQPVFLEADAEQQAATLDRLALLEAAVSHTDARRVSQLTLMPDFDIAVHGPWFASVQLARDLGLPLWADDTSLRLLARQSDVRAFGTLDLLEYLRDLQLERLRSEDNEGLEQVLAESQSLVRTALAQRVVDVPATLEDLLVIAAGEGFPLDLAYSVIARPAWWAWHPFPWHDLRRLLEDVATHDAVTGSRWRVAAMQGVALLREDIPGSAALLMATALVLPVDALTEESTDQLMTAASDMAAHFGVEQPSSYIALACVALQHLGLVPDAGAHAGRYIGAEQEK